MQVIEIEDDGVRIHQKGRMPKNIIEFFNKLNYFYERGYVFRETKTEGAKIRCAPKVIPQIIVGLYPEGENIFELKEDIKKLQRYVKELEFEVEYQKDKNNFNSDKSKLDYLKALTKKDPLLSFAKENNIQIPTQMISPQAIKKYIKENI